jgi:transglutaminase-like putative cysteine protease
MAWAITLAVGVVALLFPLLAQPVLGQVSPFNIPAMNRLRTAPPFTQLNNQRASVGQGPINLSPTPVYEVYTPETGRLRTAVFSSYSGREWRQGIYDYPVEVRPRGSIALQPFPGDSSQASYQQYQYHFDPYPEARGDVARHDVLQRFVTRGYNSQGIPGLGHIKELHYPHQFVSLHPSGCVSGTAHVSSGKAFEVLSSILEPTPDQLRAAPALERDSFAVADTLALPQSAERVRALAQRITAGSTNDYDRVQAVLGYIEKNCQYTLQEEVTPQGEDAADYYLFTTKRGACDLAATAAAIMCRSVGIPARVAVGYVMEEPLPQGGGFLVRQEHAHMWTEIFFPDYGWIPFDAAPPLARIKDNPLQVAWLRFMGLFSKVGGGGLDAVLLVLVIAGTLILVGSWAFSGLRSRVAGLLRRRLRGGTPQEAIAGAYDRTLAHLARRGWAREAWMTPTEYLAALEPDWATSEGRSAIVGLRTLTELFQQAHYGGEASALDLSAAEEAARSVCRLVPRRKTQRAALTLPNTMAEGAT